MRNVSRFWQQKVHSSCAISSASTSAKKSGVKSTPILKNYAAEGKL